MLTATKTKVMFKFKKTFKLDKYIGISFILKKDKSNIIYTITSINENRDKFMLNDAYLFLTISSFLENLKTESVLILNKSYV